MVKNNEKYTPYACDLGMIYEAIMVRIISTLRDVALLGNTIPKNAGYCVLIDLSGRYVIRPCQVSYLEKYEARNTLVYKRHAVGNAIRLREAYLEKNMLSSMAIPCNIRLSGGAVVIENILSGDTELPLILSYSGVDSEWDELVTMVTLIKMRWLSYEQAKQIAKESNNQVFLERVRLF